jgi:hypothetical protein
MNDLEELLGLVPPRDPPPPPVDWEAAQATLGVDYPADYKALVEAYEPDEDDSRSERPG